MIVGPERRKLDLAERIRLEALNQAVGSLSLASAKTVEILARAKEFEGYLKTGNINIKER